MIDIALIEQCKNPNVETQIIQKNYSNRKQ